MSICPNLLILNTCLFKLWRLFWRSVVSLRTRQVRRTNLSVLGECAERTWACSASARNKTKLAVLIECTLQKFELYSYKTFWKIRSLWFAKFCNLHQNRRRLHVMKLSVIGKYAKVNWRTWRIRSTTLGALAEHAEWRHFSHNSAISWPRPKMSKILNY